MNDSVSLLEVEVKKLLSSIAGAGLNGKSDLWLAGTEAKSVSDILYRGNKNLAASWERLSSLCISANDKVREELDFLVVSLDTFINEAKENDAAAQVALDKTNEEADSIVKEFDLLDGLG